MFTRLMAFVRNRWHPLWRLRRLPAFRYLQEHCDFTIYSRIPETDLEVALKLMRDASWIAGPANLEPDVRKAFALALDLLKPAVFWDIGSNIGFYSWFVRRFHSIREVRMFEPDPINFALITKTIRKNAISDCHAFNVALSDRAGDAAFLVDRASGATGSLEVTSHRENESSLHSAYGLAETITCRTATIDGLIAEGAPAPDLMKIDVEGAEHLVLAGAASCLAQHHPAIIIETSNATLIRQLIALGYAAFQIDAGNLLLVSDSHALDSLSRVFSRFAG